MSEKIMLSRFATKIVNTPLLIAVDKLNVIIGAVGSQIGLDVPESIAAFEYVEPDRDRSEAGDSLAVIPVYDTLVYRTYGLSALSGLTTYEQIRADFKRAMDDPSVRAIVFDIDSPGGEVAGCFDLVDEIYQARGAKPVYAVANEMAYSAAYAIASAADEIYVPRTGGIGSIGVIAIHVDQSSFNEKTGVQYTPIFAGSRKNDFSPHEPLSDEARSVAQSEVDEVYELFVDTVARNRNMSPVIVKNTEAGIFQGKNALDAGLVDQVLSWEQVIEKITSKIMRGVHMKGNLKSKIEALFSDVPGEEVSAALLEFDYVPKGSEKPEEPPVDVEKVKEEARTEGKQEALKVTKEIMEICSLAGMPGMALTFIEEGVDAEEARKKVIAAKAKQNSTEITSTVGAVSTGEVNPLTANAEKRAKDARKEV